MCEPEGQLFHVGDEGASEAVAYLEVIVADLQNVGDVEGAVLGAAGLFHHLGVHVARRRHDGDDVLALLIEEEGGVADLGAGQQEVVHGTEGVRRQVVDLNRGGTVIPVKTTSIVHFTWEDGRNCSCFDIFLIKAFVQIDSTVNSGTWH